MLHIGSLVLLYQENFQGESEVKFLHIADLHLGKSLYGVSMIDNQDQVFWVDGFLKKAKELRPDAVLIAGDIYDRSAPPGEAVVLFNHMLTGLEEMGIPVLMAAGNHDSGKRLSFAGKILAKQGIYIAGMAEREIAHVTIPERDGSGEVTFWMLPYLFPAMAAQLLEKDLIGDYETAVRELLACQEIDFSKRNVLLAHQNVTAGGKEAPRGGSESMVGGVGQIDYRVFDGFDYVALGHIHASYHVGRKEVRYAGSPLCYHFDETKQPRKGPLLVKLGAKGNGVEITPVFIRPLHPMREIRGAWETILASLEQENNRGEYLKIVVTDRRITPEMSEFLREQSGKRDSVVMELTSSFRELDAVSSLSGEYSREKSVEDYFVELYRERRGQAEPEEKDMALFRFAAGQARERETSEKREEGLEQDAEKLLAYVLKQEERGE